MQIRNVESKIIRLAKLSEPRMKFIYLVALLLSFILVQSCGNSESKVNNIVTIAGVEYKTIPGLQAVDVHGNFTINGFKLTTNLTAEPASWACRKEDLGASYSVTAFGRSADQITLVDAHVVSRPEKIVNVSREFISYVASIPYKGANPEAASNWAVSKVKNGGDTIINGVTFKISLLSKTTTTIKIYCE
jgi:hypothetical protein